MSNIKLWNARRTENVEIYKVLDIILKSNTNTWRITYKFNTRYTPAAPDTHVMLTAWYHLAIITVRCCSLQLSRVNWQSSFALANCSSAREKLAMHGMKLLRNLFATITTGSLQDPTPTFTIYSGGKGWKPGIT